MRRKKRVLKKKSPLIFILLALVLIGGVAYVALRKTPEEKGGLAQVPEDIIPVYPRLYSDTHITENAKVSDPQFKTEVVFDQSDLLASVLPSVRVSKGAPVPEGQEKGTWLWTPLLQITPAYRHSMIRGAKENGVSAIYLSLDSYLDIYVMPEGPDKKAKQKKFDTALEAFVTEARKNGIAVDAEGGWQNWAEEGHLYKPFALLDYVIAFNKTHDEKLRGFQYDVEPYLLPSYEENKTETLRNFLKLINKSLTRLDGSNLLFSVVIPEFYDGEERATPWFFYAWGRRHTLGHLLTLLDRRPGSAVVVMSYRNFAEGTDGAIDISRREIDAANKSRTRVVIAQETGDFEPP
ncbi:MAG TPA: hypothetical protein VJG29_00995, partial [Candidatus Paceibacterota bacterium]